MRALIFRLKRDRRGATMVEFALIAPVLVVALIGLFDLCYNIYAATMLEGAIQQAARDSTIEGAGSTQSAIDTRVTDVVQDIVPSATLTFNRTAYIDFADVARPEDFTDSDSDGVCNAGEPFEDANGNGLWDSDRGSTGMGGARDAVLYTVTVTYNRQFPLHRLLGVPGRVTTVARTVLRNQPFAMQERAVTVENCT